MKTAAKLPSIRRGEQGYTLIEMLLALGVMSMAMASVAGGLHAIGRSWSANALALQRQDMVMRGLAIFARDVRGLRRMTWNANGSRRYALDGSRVAMQLIAHEPPYPGLGGHYAIRYRVVDEAGGQALIRERQPVAHGAVVLFESNFSDAVALLHGPYRFRFDYGVRHDGGRTWLDRWSSDENIPDLVRLHIEDRRTGQLVIPSLVVRPRVEAEHECIRPRSSLCRLARAGGLAENAGPSKELEGAR